MSKLRTAGGDDHPDAALKHLLDSETLLAQSRADGAAYLSGYVVECALKSLWLHETGVPAGNAMPWGRRGHDIGLLASHVAALASVAGVKTAAYFKTASAGVLASAIAHWKPEMRYRSPSMTPGDALAWYIVADAVYQETVARMRLDGVI